MVNKITTDQLLNMDDILVLVTSYLSISDITRLTGTCSDINKLILHNISQVAIDRGLPYCSTLLRLHTLYQGEVKDILMEAARSNDVRVIDYWLHECYNTTVLDVYDIECIHVLFSELINIVSIDLITILLSKLSPGYNTMYSLAQLAARTTGDLDIVHLFNTGHEDRVFKHQLLVYKTTQGILIEDLPQFEQGVVVRAAASTGDIELVRLLLTKYPQDRCTGILCTAAERGYLNIVELLLPYSKDLNKTMGAAGRGGNLDIVKLLITNGAGDLSVTVIQAAVHNHIHIVSYYLDKVDEYYLQLALSEAITHNSTECIQLLLPYGTKLSILAAAIASCNLTLVRKYIVDVDPVTLESMASSAMLCYRRDSIAVIKLLIDAGVVTSIMAAKYGRLDVIDMLNGTITQLHVEVANSNTNYRTAIHLSRMIE